MHKDWKPFENHVLVPIVQDLLLDLLPDHQLEFITKTSQKAHNSHTKTYPLDTSQARRHAAINARVTQRGKFQNPVDSGCPSVPLVPCSRAPRQRTSVPVVARPSPPCAAENTILGRFAKQP